MHIPPEAPGPAGPHRNADALPERISPEDIVKTRNAIRAAFPALPVDHPTHVIAQYGLALAVLDAIAAGHPNPQAIAEAATRSISTEDPTP